MRASRLKFPVRFLFLFTALLLPLILIAAHSTQASVQEFPNGFQSDIIFTQLDEPASLSFAPDGRMFIAERITGRLLVAKLNGGVWQLNAEPFYTFDVPKDAQGNPQGHRSSGLRDIAFDPDFASNGYIYAYYMKDQPRHNRLVRLQASPGNPDLAQPGSETLLISVPLSSGESSGSHNGGAVEFGPDGRLYFTTGDGWSGGDPVQSLTTFTGKVFRLNKDGSIPTDNPFYGQTTGAYRAIYALGLRNPYTVSRHPQTGVIYINDASGPDKADVFILQAGANYGHQGYGGIGTQTSRWVNAAAAGNFLVTGGAWYPQSGPFPPEYHGAYFMALWGGNPDAYGQINVAASNTNPTVSKFADLLGFVSPEGFNLKPVMTQVGPDGNLYYLMTTYETKHGQVMRVRFTGQPTVATPQISPAGATSVNPVQVTLATATTGAQIRYTLDGRSPDQSSPLYTGPFTVSSSAYLQVRAFRSGFAPSGLATAVFIIGADPANIPPLADAGPDVSGKVGEAVTLDGGASFDPDGDDQLLTWQWQQLGGPPVTLSDSSDTVTFFTPAQTGLYTFRLTVSDGEDSSSDDVLAAVVEPGRLADGQRVLYTLGNGQGTAVSDISFVAPALPLQISSAAAVTWLDGGLAVKQPATIASAGPAAKINDACREANAITVEVWLKPANTTQDGPARIVTISDGLDNRNVTLAQDGGRYQARLRTTVTSLNGLPALQTANGAASTTRTHLVFTRSTNGSARIYLNGAEAASGSIGGNLSNWAADYPLLLANEAGGERPWLGELYLTAVYCRALSAAEVTQNYQAGPNPWLKTHLPLIFR